jgi:Fur family peroxide stress response transcriptional regulator
MGIASRFFREAIRSEQKPGQETLSGEGLTNNRRASIIRNDSELGSMKPEDIQRRIIEGMRDKGLKLTSQRLVIIEILARRKSHPSAPDVLAKARKKAPRISLSTVYYTLDMLKREGLIRELEFTDRDNRYEGDISDHLNLVCKRCGKIEDFPASSPVPAEKVAQKAGFKVDGVRLEYYGYCRECQVKRP